MTCIVGYKYDGKVYIGGDSAGVGAYDIRIRTDEKVFKNGKAIFGFTSSFRMGQILRYKLKLPKHPPEMSNNEYVNTLLIDEIIKCLKDNGFAAESNNVIEGGQFLMGYGGELYDIMEDFQVATVAEPYNACGCGIDYALGAMYNLVDGPLGKKPVKLLTQALETAAHFSNGVCGPYKVVCI